MRILSYNVRGICAPKRHRIFLSLKRELRHNVFLLQEIKIMEGKYVAIKNTLWREGDHAMVHASGRSGGILCFQDRKKLGGKVIVVGQIFINPFTLLDSKENIIVTNVYAPTIVLGRKVLWSSLNQMRKAFRGFCWIVAGDFNVSLYPLEKMGGVDVFTNDMKDFAYQMYNDNLMNV